MNFSKITKSPIVLKEENRRYAFDPGKEMFGYMKVEQDEDKGLIVVIMDNIKFFPKGEYVYKLVLAGTKNEKRCYHMIGNISLNAYGKGEASFRINPQDLDGSGTALSDYSMAIIAAMSTVNCRESLHPVLKGSISVPEPQQAPEKTGSLLPKNYNAFYNRVVLEKCIALAKEQTSFEDIVPFAEGSIKASWKKITDQKKFPMVAPGADGPIEKYGHFLWGYNDNHYFLAVPGRFLPEEKPDDGKSGFVFWLPILGMEKAAEDRSVPVEERRKNIYGYWIASVNRYNGHIEEIPLIDD